LGRLYRFAAEIKNIPDAVTVINRNSLAIEPDENTLFELSEVRALKIIGENNIEESIDFNIDGKSIIANTTTLKEGVKFVKLFLNNGEIITKRIIVKHE
jgi:hypothetical protein